MCFKYFFYEDKNLIYRKVLNRNFTTDHVENVQNSRIFKVFFKISEIPVFLCLNYQIPDFSILF